MLNCVSYCLSPQYHSAKCLSDPARSFSVQFPRVVRFAVQSALHYLYRTGAAVCGVQCTVKYNVHCVEQYNMVVWLPLHIVQVTQYKV